jgi:AraC-like DNA-binding protein
VRCERAKHYLHTTNLTVERIGELCSYSNSAKFGNFFKRVTGMSPGQYRRSKKNVVKSGESISSVAKD